MNKFEVPAFWRVSNRFKVPFWWMNLGSSEFIVRPVEFEAVQSSLYLGLIQHLDCPPSKNPNSTDFSSSSNYVLF